MKYLVLAVLLAGCDASIDPPWQLDHDRIIAVRATPPRIVAGAQSEIDTLVGRKGARPTPEVPPGAQVVSPQSLATALRFEANRWIVTAPDEARLAAVRTELGLAPGAPVPLVVGVGFPETAFSSGLHDEPVAAIKTVWLGEAAENPTLVTDPAETPELVVAPLTNVPLFVEVGEGDDVNWLTSCGTMHDFDLPESYLRVELEDPMVGDLAVVVRTELGGVAWRVWSIRAE
ncbi:MAG: hypothetical protein H0T42_23665 [Deltaproteobacteria bacterium]|nr:hypothetical protein [Deltaproteobacteria bacterium]